MRMQHVFSLLTPTPPSTARIPLSAITRVNVNAGRQTSLTVKCGLAWYVFWVRRDSWPLLMGQHWISYPGEIAEEWAGAIEDARAARAKVEGEK